MVKKVLLLISLIFLVDAVFATTHYLQVINPNDYDLTNFQIKLNLTKYNIEPPIAQITTLDGSNVPFCYEQNNGECNETYENATGIVWMKIPYIPKRDYVVLKIVVNGTNGATNGYQVFDFYDDFNDGVIDYTKWSDANIGEYTGTTTAYESNGYLVLKGDGTSWSTFESTVYFSGNNIYEMSVVLGGHSMHFGIADSVDSQRVAYADKFSDYYIDITWKIDGTYYSTDNLAAYSAGEYYVKYTKVGDTIIAEIPQLNLVVTKSAEPWESSSFSITFYVKGSVEQKVNWVRVRKYADQDPVVKIAYSKSDFSPQSPSQTSTEYNQTYLYVRQITVLPENSVSVSNAQVILELDTQSLIAEGKMKSDCSDIYITYYDPLYGELPAKFWVDPTTCNTKATRIYVKLPIISVNNDWIVNVYYGSPGAIPVWDPKNTFTFYVDLTNPSDISQNLIIRTEGTTSIDYTSNGLVVQTGSDGKVLIINK